MKLNCICFILLKCERIKYYYVRRTVYFIESKSLNGCFLWKICRGFSRRLRGLTLLYYFVYTGSRISTSSVSAGVPVV